MAPRLKVKYDEEVAKSLMDQFDYSNVMQVPKIEKIVVGADGKPKTETASFE